MATATGASCSTVPITTRTSSSWCFGIPPRVDYTLIDCGANYGYWSVLVSSAPLGSHKAIAIEPSSQNFAKLRNNAEINGNRFELMKCAIGAARGTARLSGTKHEAFSIAGDPGSGGEEVPVIALDNLLDDGKVSAGGKYLIKLDVEGVEIDAIKGGTRLLQGDSVILCEEHGNDPRHTVSRYILEQTPLKLIVYDPAQPAVSRPSPSFRFSTASRFHPTSATTCSAPQARSGRTGSMP